MPWPFINFLFLTISHTYAGQPSIGWCTSMSPFVDDDAIPIYHISDKAIGHGSRPVYAASVKGPDGNIKKLAFKSVHPDLANALEAKEKLLQPIFKSSSSSYFNKIHGSNFKCFAKTSTGSMQLDHVVMTDLASGSAEKLISHIKLDPKEALTDPKNFDRKLAIYEKYAEQNLIILDILKKNGLVHSDIKPDNIFFTTSDSNIDLAKISAQDLEFQIGDYDTLVKKDSHLIGKTSPYLSPETFLLNIAKHEQDIYASSASLFDMMTGKPPVDFARETDKSIPNKVQSIEDHEKVRKSVDNYFEKFSSLNKSNPDFYKRIQNLHNIIVTGTSYDPAKRFDIMKQSKTAKTHRKLPEINMTDCGADLQKL